MTLLAWFSPSVAANTAPTEGLLECSTLFRPRCYATTIAEQTQIPAQNDAIFLGALSEQCEAAYRAPPGDEVHPSRDLTRIPRSNVLAADPYGELVLLGVSDAERDLRRLFDNTATHWQTIWGPLTLGTIAWPCQRWPGGLETVAWYSWQICQHPPAVLSRFIDDESALFRYFTSAACPLSQSLSRLEQARRLFNVAVDRAMRGRGHYNRRELCQLLCLLLNHIDDSEPVFVTDVEQSLRGLSQTQGLTLVVELVDLFLRHARNRQTSPETADLHWPNEIRESETFEFRSLFRHLQLAYNTGYFAAELPAATPTSTTRHRNRAQRQNAVDLADLFGRGNQPTAPRIGDSVSPLRRPDSAAAANAAAARSRADCASALANLVYLDFSNEVEVRTSEHNAQAVGELENSVLFDLINRIVNQCLTHYKYHQDLTCNSINQAKAWLGQQPLMLALLRQARLRSMRFAPTVTDFVRVYIQNITQEPWNDPTGIALPDPDAVVPVMQGPARRMLYIPENDQHNTK